MKRKKVINSLNKGELFDKLAQNQRCKVVLRNYKDGTYVFMPTYPKKKPLKIGGIIGYKLNEGEYRIAEIVGQAGAEMLVSVIRRALQATANLTQSDTMDFVRPSDVVCLFNLVGRHYGKN